MWKSASCHPYFDSVRKETVFHVYEFIYETYMKDASGLDAEASKVPDIGQGISELNLGRLTGPPGEIS
jgi:hypothetical protein